MLRGKTVCLVGGMGFVGHNLAYWLSEAGARVVIIDPMLINNLFSLDWEENDAHRSMVAERIGIVQSSQITFFTSDGRDYHTLSRMLSRLKPDIIVHLAAIAHINRANKDPLTTFDHSLRTLENSLDVARNIGCERFVYFSSSTVYGNFGKDVLTETDECNPFGVYAGVKMAGEVLTRTVCKTYDIPYTIIRPCALYGPRCISGRVVQKFIEGAIAGEKLTIHGDGLQGEDFTYIDDLIQGVILAMDKEEGIGQTFNITAGKARSLNDLATIVTSRFPVDIIHGEKDLERPMRGTLSIEKAKKLLGYEPHNNLESGLESYIEWYLEFIERMSHGNGDEKKATHPFSGTVQ